MNSPEKLDSHSFRYFALVGVVVMALLFAIVIPVTSDLARKAALVDLGQYLLEHAKDKYGALFADVDRVQQDTLFLANTPPIQGIVRAVENGSFDSDDNSSLQAWKARLQTIFAEFLRTHPYVTQVRYLGIANNGRELVRVNRRDDQPVAVPESDLQSKADRDYFAEILRRKPGEVYLSTISLNRERGEIETPHVPTIRAGTMVYDRNGQPFGMVVINYTLASRLAALSAISDGGIRTYLMNSAGDYLAHPDPSKTFGFELGRRHRWQEEFKALPERPRGSPAELLAYKGPQGDVQVVINQLPLVHYDPDHYVTLAVVAPNTLVDTRVATARWVIIAVLTGLSAIAAVFLYLIALNVRRRDQARLQDARLAAIVNCSNDAIIGETLEGIITSWNRAAESVFGFSESQAVGKSTRDLIVPSEHAEEERAVLAQVSKGEAVARFETKRLRADGQLIDTSVTVSPVFSNEGDIISAAMIARDITLEMQARAKIEEINANLERKVSERTAQLQKAQAIQAAILEHAAYAIIATDVTGTILLFNPAAEELLGYSEQEMVGRKTPQVFHDADEVRQRAEVLSNELGCTVEAGFEAFVAKARTGLSDTNEWTYIRKDGSRVPVQLSVSSLRDDGGAIVGFLGIAFDLSERRRNQQELLQAKAAAEEANRAKSDFLANMSHEIRTPMNAVIGMLQLMHYTDLTEKQAEYIAKADAGAQLLLGIINDVLDFSRIEAGKLELDPQPFDIDALFHEIAMVLGISVGEKDIEVLFDIDDSVPSRIIADSFRLKQVLVNLASNAAKFTEHGEILFSVRAVKREGGRVELDFAVRDTGIGMSPEQLAAVVKPFTQADAGITRQFGGTGLGLSISQKLIALMGGELKITSEQWRGSQFAFTIEARMVEYRDVTLATREVPATVEGLRVLIVDDNQHAGELIAKMSRMLTWRPDTALDAEDAARQLRESVEAGDPIRLILLDWSLVGTKGWQVIGTLRGEAALASVAIVIMATAHSRKILYEILKRENAGINGVIIKPATPSDLLNVAAKAIAGPLDDTRRTRKAPPPRLAGMRVLLVEDNATNREVAEDLLESFGAQVHTACNGARAIDQLRDHPRDYDAVLMDMQMPEVDGLTATRRIRGELGLVDLPIIAMTANAMASDRAACLAAGMNEHVGKPFKIEAVVSLLLSITGRQDAAAALEPPPAQQSARFAGYEAALARMGSNRALYAKHAHRLAKRAEASLAAAREALAAGDRDEAGASLHTLKGAVASLGLDATARTLSVAEQAIRRGLPHPLADAETALSSELRELDQFVRGLEGPLRPEREAASGESYSAELARLTELLSTRNLRAQEAYARIRPALLAAADQGVSELDSAMDSLDFATALRCLSRIRARLKPDAWGSVRS